MKKLNLFLMLMAVAATTLFVSCSKSDDNTSDGNTSGTTTTTKQASVTYVYAFNKSFLDYFTVTIKYYDADGNVKSVDANSLSDKTITGKDIDSTVVCKVWTQTVSYASVTATSSYKSGFKVVLARRSDVTPTKDIDFIYGQGYQAIIGSLTYGSLTYDLIAYGGIRPSDFDSFANSRNKITAYHYILSASGVTSATLDF